MNKHKKLICRQCNKLVSKKNIGKIRGVLLCKKCQIEVRKKHREETIKAEGIKEELEELDKKAKREYAQTDTSREYHREYYHKKYPNARYYNQAPTIKTNKKIKTKNNCYLTIGEKQSLLRILMDKGLEFNDAKERISNLIKSQRELKEKLKNKHKSEIEIIKELKIKQKQMIEQLWNY